MVEIKKKTKGTRSMCTILLGVLSSGHKLPIYLVFKSSSKVILPDELSPYLVVRNNSSGWMDAQLFEDYVERILLYLILPPNTHLIFVLDKARIHLAEKVLSKIALRTDIFNFFFGPKWLHYSRATP